MKDSDSAGGIFVTTLIPFAEDGSILFQSVTDQARRLALIDGVSGIAVHTELRERLTLTRFETAEVIVRTRRGLRPNQCLLDGAGEIPHSISDLSWDHRAARADETTGQRTFVHQLAQSSWLAYLAPHEAAELVGASPHNNVPDTMALHNRLAPLIALIDRHDPDTREMIYREAAHDRGLLASTDARAIDALCPRLQNEVHRTIEELDLKPISWV